MRVDLESSTDTGYHALVDPKVAPTLVADTSEGGVFTKEFAASPPPGVFYADGSFEARFTIFVDEDPPERLLSRARGRVSGVVEAPGGRIVPLGDEPRDPPSAVTLAPGTYSVEAFEVEWDEREIAAEIARDMDREVGRVARVVSGALGLIGCLGCLGPFVGLFVAISGDLGYAPITGSRWVDLLAPGFIILLVSVILATIPSVSRATVLRQKLHERYETHVMVLKLLAGSPEPSNRRGVAFGTGFTEPELSQKSSHNLPKIDEPPPKVSTRPLGVMVVGATARGLVQGLCLAPIAWLVLERLGAPELELPASLGLAIACVVLSNADSLAARSADSGCLAIILSGLAPLLGGMALIPHPRSLIVFAVPDVMAAGVLAIFGLALATAYALSGRPRPGAMASLGRALRGATALAVLLGFPAVLTWSTARFRLSEREPLLILALAGVSYASALGLWLGSLASRPLVRSLYRRLDPSA